MFVRDALAPTMQLVVGAGSTHAPIEQLWHGPHIFDHVQSGHPRHTVHGGCGLVGTHVFDQTQSGQPLHTLHGGVGLGAGHPQGTILTKPDVRMLHGSSWVVFIITV